MPSRVDRLEKRKKKVIKKSLSKMKDARAEGKSKKEGRIADRGDRKLKNIDKKIGKSMARQEDRGKRKAGEETRLEQRQRKTYKKGIEAIREGKGKKAMKLLKKTGKQQQRMEKRGKGETGLYPIISGAGSNKGGTTYGGKVKTSGMRKKAKKNR